MAASSSLAASFPLGAGDSVGASQVGGVVDPLLLLSVVSGSASGLSSLGGGVASQRVTTVPLRCCGREVILHCRTSGVILTVG